MRELRSNTGWAIYLSLCVCRHLDLAARGVGPRQDLLCRESDARVNGTGGYDRHGLAARGMGPRQDLNQGAAGIAAGCGGAGGSVECGRGVWVTQAATAGAVGADSRLACMPLCAWSCEGHGHVDGHGPRPRARGPAYSNAEPQNW